MSISASSETQSISSYLAGFDAFRNLEPEQLEWLASKSQFFKADAGKSLLQSDRLPDFCYCLLRGKGRLLHHDPALRRPVTLAFCNPGDLLGWSGLARRSPCEWITASSDLYLLGFPADAFYELEKSSPSFRTWLDTNNSPAELMSVLEPSLQARSIAEPSDRDVLRRLVPHMQLFSARISRDFRQQTTKFICGTLQFRFSSPVGTPVILNCETIPPSISLRLFVVDKDIWNTAFQPQSDLPLPEPTFLVSDDDESHRYSDIISPLSDTSDSSTGLDSVNRVTDDDFIFKGKRIPVVCGTGDLEEVVAVLSMFTSYFNVPFRKDIVERAARESLILQTYFKIIGNLSTIIGFVGTITDIPTSQLHRVSFLVSLL